jgi:hypothetical protein
MTNAIAPATMEWAQDAVCPRFVLTQRRKAAKYRKEMTAEEAKNRSEIA